MRAAAPGKLVLSGAYAVLDGAPAIVAAVDRWVVADTSRAAEFVTPELEAALAGRPAPWFDASALRDDERKLGLGSSAAIVVACLAALALERSPDLDDRALADAVLSPALDAHRRAQQGGSGIDVAASARGGVLIATRAEGLTLRATALPPGLVIETWTSGQPASTPALVGRVDALPPAERKALLAPQADAAALAARAVDTGDAHAFVDALDRQHAALAALGAAAGAPIVTPAVAELRTLARREGATVLPSGAGGGDVALFVGRAPPSAALSARARALSHQALSLRLGARGVHRAALGANT